MQRNIVIGVILLAASLFLIDRYYWAQIAQWREDQATNLWLGYTRGIRGLPVGLISSRKLPNPNGMPLLGSLLSILPNLLTVSFLLGVAQMVLIALVGWKVAGRSLHYFLLATLPGLSSVLLRSISVEFWNQYVITLLNILFIFWAVRYLQTGSLWNLPPIAALILFAPALYLAGIVNAIVMTLLAIGMLIYKRPALRKAGFAAAVIAVLVLASWLVTWRPYFQNVSLEQIVKYSQIKPDPPGSSSLAFKHADPRILAAPTQFFLSTAEKLYLLQAVFAAAAVLCMLLPLLFKRSWGVSPDWKIDSSLLQTIVLCGLFVILAYAFSALLGGPDWLSNERSDQTVQFLPLRLLVVYLLPFLLIRTKPAEALVRRLATILLALFVGVNLLCGFMILRDHLQYRGNVLTEADVPLIEKMQVVAFVANDWRSRSISNVIPVDYDLGGGRWDWVPEFGKKLTKWYPAPMTQGRSFDYELLRRYGLTNQQEGVQLRIFGEARYLVTYAFKDPPQVADARVTHHVFGRLRVTVVEK